jgi:hypothetical protein
MEKGVGGNRGGQQCVGELCCKEHPLLLQPTLLSVNLLLRTCSVLPRSKWPPTGLAAATIDVRAGNDATRPALATLTSCCSMASRSAWQEGGCTSLVRAKGMPQEGIMGRSHPQQVGIQAWPGQFCCLGEPSWCRHQVQVELPFSRHPRGSLNRPTWCSPAILSNSSTQHTPRSPSTTAPASNMESPVTGSRTTLTVRPAPATQAACACCRRLGCERGAFGSRETAPSNRTLIKLALHSSVTWSKTGVARPAPHQSVLTHLWMCCHICTARAARRRRRPAAAGSCRGQGHPRAARGCLRCVPDGEQTARMGGAASHAAVLKVRDQTGRHGKSCA